MGFVYRLDFTSGKSYVGITTKSVAMRFKAHARNVKSGRLAHVYAAWRKYGAPSAVCLEELPNCELHAAEVRWVLREKTLRPGGYNMTTGGDISPALMPEVKLKMSAAQKAYAKTPDGIARINRNKIKSPETGAKISAALKLRNANLEYRKRMGEAIRRGQSTNKARANMSAGQRHRAPMSVETKGRLADIGRAFSLTPEGRAIISRAADARRLQAKPK